MVDNGENKNFSTAVEDNELDKQLNELVIA